MGSTPVCLPRYRSQFLVLATKRDAVAWLVQPVRGRCNGILAALAVADLAEGDVKSSEADVDAFLSSAKNKLASEKLTDQEMPSVAL